MCVRKVKDTRQEEKKKGRGKKRDIIVHTNVYLCASLCVFGRECKATRQSSVPSLSFLWMQDGESVYPVSLGQSAQRRKSVGCKEKRHRDSSGVKASLTIQESEEGGNENEENRRVN